MMIFLLIVIYNWYNGKGNKNINTHVLYFLTFLGVLVYCTDLSLSSKAEHYRSEGSLFSER